MKLLQAIQLSRSRPAFLKLCVLCCAILSPSLSAAQALATKNANTNTLPESQVIQALEQWAFRTLPENEVVRFVELTDATQPQTRVVYLRPNNCATCDEDFLQLYKQLFKKESFATAELYQIYPGAQQPSNAKLRAATPLAVHLQDPYLTAFTNTRSDDLPLLIIMNKYNELIGSIQQFDQNKLTKSLKIIESAHIFEPQTRLEPGEIQKQAHKTLAPNYKSALLGEQAAFNTIPSELKEYESLATIDYRAEYPETFNLTLPATSYSAGFTSQVLAEASPEWFGLAQTLNYQISPLSTLGVSWTTATAADYGLVLTADAPQPKFDHKQISYYRLIEGNIVEINAQTQDLEYVQATEYEFKVGHQFWDQKARIMFGASFNRSDEINHPLYVEPIDNRIREHFVNLNVSLNDTWDVAAYLKHTAAEGVLFNPLEQVRFTAGNSFGTELALYPLVQSSNEGLFSATYKMKNNTSVALGFSYFDDNFSRKYNSLFSRYQSRIGNWDYQIIARLSHMEKGELFADLFSGQQAQNFTSRNPDYDRFSSVNLGIKAQRKIPNQFLPWEQNTLLIAGTELNYLSFHNFRDQTSAARVSDEATLQDAQLWVELGFKVEFN